jgi:AraC-like DNA-binding protein
MQKLKEQRSGLTGWVLAIARGITAEGENAEDVLREVGMDPAQLEGGYNRYSQEQISALWQLAIKRTADPALGLRVAAQVRPSTFHVVGYAMSCSATLLRALRRFSFYCRLISDSATATLTETSDRVQLQFYLDTGEAPPTYQTVDTVLASVLTFLRWVAGEKITPMEVALEHAQPRSDTRYRDFYGVPVKYLQSQNSITFARSDLERPILGADEELATLLDGIADRYLERRMAGRFAVRVRDSLIAQLQHGAPTKSATARRLNTTERTLLRRLKEEGTTFAEVLDRLREELAFQHLSRGDMSLSDIAEMLGFSDHGTFSRAFKRWTGRRPSSVRIEAVPSASEARAV